MTIANRNLELYEALALDGLSQCAGPITFRQLLEIADPRDKEKIDPEKMRQTVAALVDESFIKFHAPTGCGSERFSITALGRARYSGRSPFGELHASAKAEADGAMVDEMRGARKYTITEDELKRIVAASYPTVTIHERPEPPAVATVCVDENELDEWWESLDIDQKADAFTGFALRMYAGESHVHICRDERIPVAGTIGEASAEVEKEG